MLLSDPSIKLSDDEFRLLRDYIHEYCGIFFDDASKYLLERRLGNRLRQLHIASFKDYYRFLRYDRRRDDELVAAMDVLTINETYFFREQRQLDAFSKEILPELKERNVLSRKLRIWSAGCSTGEEPYTLAMLIMEDGGFAGWDVSIFGSDINQRVLQNARRGVYRQNSFRTIDKYFLGRYFEPDEGETYRISDRVKRYVNFGNLNLVEAARLHFLDTMDIIFCRNVRIYFDESAKKKVVQNFYDRLCDGGYLLLGHAESLINISTAFRLKHLQNDMVYQKNPPPSSGGTR
ncbi:MAG: protein-glutamate O-methyltransferase CheR [Nitrospirae bacterium]|nr:protein-glutamate O-methyltransferase CheR [Nitrospirota bacterium]